MEGVAQAPEIPDFIPLLQPVEMEVEPVEREIEPVEREVEPVYAVPSQLQRRLPSSIYIRKPKDLKWCQSASPIQFFNLFLIVYYYIYLLVVENYTFGWKGALGAYGLKLEVHSNERCKHSIQKPLHFKDANGKEITELRWNHYPICEVFHTQANNQLFLNLILIAFATLVNFLCYQGKSIKNSVQGVISLVVLVIYLFYSSYVIYSAVIDNYKAEKYLPLDMEEALSGDCVYPDDISSLWATTQAKSECCGGQRAQDWNFCNNGTRYHFSCLNTRIYKYQEMTALNYPNEKEIWKEGCVGKELRKMHGYSRFMITSLIIQTVCCAVIIGSFAYAPLGSILPISATFKIISRNRKGIVIMRGDRGRFTYSLNADRFIIRMRDVNSRNEVEEDVEIPEYYCRRLFRSRYLLSVCESQMLILQVEVSGHSSLIQTIRYERVNENGNEYLKVFNG